MNVGQNLPHVTGNIGGNEKCEMDHLEHCYSTWDGVLQAEYNSVHGISEGVEYDGEYEENIFVEEEENGMDISAWSLFLLCMLLFQMVSNGELRVGAESFSLDVRNALTCESR